MSTGNEAWIQDSLTRLEALEAERDRLKATGRFKQAAELEEEIASLYEVLEAAAQGEEDEAEPAANQGRPVTREFDSPPSSPWGAPEPEPQSSPFAYEESPFSSQESPFAASSLDAPEPAASFEPAPSFVGGGSLDVDEPRRLPIVPIAAALVVVLAAGGWFVMGDSAEPTPAAAPAASASVIQSAAIPDDTQNPNVAKGADVDRTRAQTIKEPRDRPRRNDGPRQSRPEQPQKPTGHSIKVDKSMDPLGGVK